MPNRTPNPLETSPAIRLQPWPKPMLWVTYAIAAVVMAAVLAQGWVRPMWLDEPVRVVAGTHTAIEMKIDPNVAEWPELCQLPQIGPKTAKRIVAYRTEQRAAGAAEPIFGRLEDLDAVRGIGPKTLARIAPFLMLPDANRP